ncbi:uncharacterized protein LOC109421207 [Aedes albopictus]|uniref:Testicular haploid expressed gene protein-like n=1 Tax=Aedes albopictus TaxID=7160 RepID=A0ABM1ZKU5_AEDAL
MGCFGGSKSKKVQPSSQTKKCQKTKPKPWSESDWKKHGHYLSQLSVPKKNYAEERLYQTPQPRKVPLSVLKPRMETLSRPKAVIPSKHDCPVAPGKCHCHVADPIRRVPARAKSYVATQRINSLSQPKLDYQEMMRCFPMQRVMCLNKRVLTPRSAYRIKKLAMPKYQHLCTPESNPYGVKPEALLAMASPRTVALAQPKSLSWAN